MNDILYLEPDEEIPSVIEKMSKSEANSIVLVIPRAATVIQSIVNLKLLKKEAENLGKKIALVTQDKVGRNLASQVGIPVYEDVESTTPVFQTPRPQPKPDEEIIIDMSEKKAKVPKDVNVHHFQERSIEPPTEKPKEAKEKVVFKKPISKFKKIIISIIAFLILVAIVIFVPRATAILKVKTDPLEQEVELLADKSLKKADFEKNSIPAELLSVEKSNKKSFQATGKKEVGEKAKGTITVFNKTGSAYQLSTGARFQSEGGLIFIATSSVTSPAGTPSIDEFGGKIQIAPGCEIPGLPIGKPLDCWIDGPNGWQEGDKVKFWGVTLIMGGARASQVHPL